MELEIALLLLAAGLVAGWIDSIVGGGGVITLPALLIAGLPPHAAVATNKVVGTGASTMATWTYLRAGLLKERRVWLWAGLAAITSAAGAATVLRMDGTIILWAVVAVMVVLSTYLLLRPDFGKRDRTRLDGRTVWLLTAFVAAAGFYDGLLGPGTGNLLLFGLVMIGGRALLTASAQGRAINWGSNVGALAFFAIAGPIEWSIGLLMALGTVGGAYLGAHANVRGQAKHVRGLFALITALLLARLLWQLWG